MLRVAVHICPGLKVPGGISEGYGHQEAPKEEHEDKVSRPAPERALLQHAAVPVPELPSRKSMHSVSVRQHARAHTCTHRVRQRARHLIHLSFQSSQGYRKIMLNRKLNPTGPKKRKFVISRHTWKRQKTNKSSVF